MQIIRLARQLTDLLNLGRSFNRTNVAAYVAEWNGISFEDYVIKEGEEQQVLTTAISQKSGTIIDVSMKPTTRFEYLLNQVKVILNTVPAPFKDDKLLSSDNELYEWGKTGRTLYLQRPQLSRCAFCGGELTKERIEELNTYYTNEASILKNRIDQIKSEINNEKQLFATLPWSLKSENDLAITCRQSYLELKKSYQQVFIIYSLLLDKLIDTLNEKYNVSLFVAQKLCPLDKSANLEMLQWITSAKQIFEDSNSIISGFSELQTQAKEQYKKHYVAKYLIENDYLNIDFKKRREEYWGEKIDQIIEDKENELKSLQNKLNSIDKGKEEINTFIKKFLNREDLSIEITEDKYFVLKRDGKTAKHLSDGEKTAIAFSHYMVLLKSLKDDHKLQDYIVFIDDPISSLDANHIAQIYSLITSFFFKKGLDPKQPDKICIFSNQLFISTHNFEFFSFINKASVFKNKNLNHRYNISRIGNNASIIKNMPKCYSDYNSEYVYLFSEINRAKEIKDSLNPGELFPEDKFYTLPNVIRRFLEVYTLIKLPGNKGEIDERVKELMGGTNELKILHNFSHFTSFERVTKHNELLSRIPDILDDVFTLLNKDPEHLKSLQEGIRE